MKTFRKAVTKGSTYKRRVRNGSDERQVNGFADVERACGQFLRSRGINYRNLAGLIINEGEDQ